MKFIQVVFLIVACYISFNKAASSLPDFVKPCKGTDPNIDECANKAANDIIPQLVNGYPPLNFPNLNPLKIQEIKVVDSGFKITIKNADVYGLDQSKASNFKIDLKSHHIQLRLNVPKLNILGEYDMSGKVLVLPLSGKGPCNLTAVDGTYDIDISYSLYDKNGVQHAKVENVGVQLDMKRGYFDFSNLLNSSKKVSDDINALLNKEWRQVLKDLDPAIKETVAAIVTTLVNSIVDKVSYSELFDNDLP